MNPLGWNPRLEPLMGKVMGEGFNRQGLNGQGINGQGLNGQGLNVQGLNGQGLNGQAHGRNLRVLGWKGSSLRLET